MKVTTRDLVLSALFLALALLLPLLTAQIPQVGAMLSPMHIPVFLCGFVCGALPGAVVGLIAPVLRSLIFSMPPMYPTAAAMAFELCAYGLLSALLYKAFPEKLWSLYAALALAMVGGRLVWGAAMWLLTIGGGGFTFESFLAGAFLNAWWGIALHLLLVPHVLLALKNAKLIEA